MNFQVLSRVVEELSSLIIGARVDRVYQGQGGALYLLLSSDREKYILLVSPDRARPRLHLVSAKPVAEDPPHGFILYLRSHVSGARVTSVGLLNQDRIVEIRFSRQGKEHCLLFELFGSAANLVLVDSSSKILAVYSPVPPAEMVARPLLPGLLYALPDKPRDPGSGQPVLSPEVDDDPSPKRTAGEKTQPGPPSSSIRTILYNGWEILVGKSAAANDQLTMKIARPDDLWFHAEGMPGSHVLIKNPKAGDIPPDVVTKAAALAAFYSKGRNAGKVSVTYTRAGLVQKPKGAKPGLVMLRERKSLMVKPEEG